MKRRYGWDWKHATQPEIDRYTEGSPAFIKLKEARREERKAAENRIFVFEKALDLANSSFSCFVTHVHNSPAANKLSKKFILGLEKKPVYGASKNIAPVPYEYYEKFREEYVTDEEIKWIKELLDASYPCQKKAVKAFMELPFDTKNKQAEALSYFFSEMTKLWVKVMNRDITIGTFNEVLDNDHGRWEVEYKFANYDIARNNGWSSKEMDRILFK